MIVLITGGAGYIGSALIKKLIDSEYDVISTDSLIRGNYKYLSSYERNPKLKLFTEDIRNQKKIEEIFKTGHNIDAIVHLAAIPGIERCRKNPFNAITTNIYGTYNIIELARKYDVDKIIFTSSAAVYGDPVKTPIEETHPLKPTNLYGITKLTAEKLMNSYYKNYGLSITILRLGNVYGVGLYTYWENVIPKFVKRAMTRQLLTIYGDGWQSRDFIHVWDVVQAIERVLKACKGVAGEVFNVGTGKPISVNFVADTISKVVRERLGNKVKKIYLPPRKGESRIRDFCLSINKIKEKLGFNPRWTVERGVNQLIDYYLKIHGERG